MRIALVTCRNIPEPDGDESLVVAAFGAAGFGVTVAAWDDNSVNWASFDAAIIRSTWNYYESPERYRNWVQEVSKVTKLFNPAETILPNIHKSYLLRMEDVGVPIVPTILPNSFGAAQTWLQENQYKKFVLKPAVSAGSWMTQTFGINDVETAETFFQEIQSAGGDPMCQPFMESVLNGGERSLVFINGQFTHKIIKQPRFSGSDEAVSEAFPVELHEAHIGHLALSVLPEAPLYARVDVIEDSGELLLSELELIEPSLFFKQNPAAISNLIEGIKSRI